MIFQIASSISVLLCIGTGAIAESIKTFEAGERVKASDMNANFGAIDITPPTLTYTTRQRDDLLYIHSISVTDETELLKFTNHSGQFIAIPSLGNANDNSLIVFPDFGIGQQSASTNQGEIFLGIGVKEISLEVLQAPRFFGKNWSLESAGSSYNSFYTATDANGNTGKLIVKTPVLEGLIDNALKDGLYQLESPIVTVGPCNIEGTQTYDDEPGVATTASHGYVSLIIDTEHYVSEGFSTTSSSSASVFSDDDSSSSSTGFPEGSLFSCPIQTAISDNDPSYSLVPRGSIVAEAQALTSTQGSNIPKISLRSSMDASISNGSLCAPSIPHISYRNRDDVTVSTSINGGTISANSDGSVTFGFESTCSIGGAVQSFTYTAVGRWISER